MHLLVREKTAEGSGKKSKFILWFFDAKIERGCPFIEQPQTFPPFYDKSRIICWFTLEIILSFVIISITNSKIEMDISKFIVIE